MIEAALLVLAHRSFVERRLATIFCGVARGLGRTQCLASLRIPARCGCS